MHISLPLLLLFLLLLKGSTSTLKQGDFGLFTACTPRKTQDIRLRCHYAACPNSPPFTCKIMTSDGHLLPNLSKNCTVPLPRHRELYRNTITSYNCTLKRKGRKEEKRITIDYSVRKGKALIKECKGTTGVALHRAPAFLWPVAALSLWRVLGTA